ncbi:molybdopterin-binding protein [Chelativorans salis]|uniref:Molybdopterin molybdenumtransferase n=1 Tax=Chelativorans salis TaxID=2978478 RepID=A0ABT2LRR9_9HYPH|nr:molybdopterin-binding protein [Chelativorans sp. EGI FJ00035]MCT7377169.1 molybdopterin-binding protein [Chelativorans sp. EGI FJ00035]
MNRIQPAKGVLTSLETALTAMLDELAPVAPTFLPLNEALGRIAAEMESLRDPLPPCSTAVMDGWALRALDLTGASAYSPVPLAASPAWVEAGDAMPEGCDCVLEADLVDCSGPISQAFAEAIPGTGVRRAGEDMAAGGPVSLPGRPLSALDLLVLRSAGLDKVAVRIPRLRVVDIAANSDGLTAPFVHEYATAAGAKVTDIETVGRDANSIASTLDKGECDLILLSGGTGRGRTDATAEALAARGALIAHDIALQPGQSAAVGRIGQLPIIALPGAPDQAFAAFLALVQPVLDRLSGRSERRGMVLPLARKISSGVGIAELVLLKREQAAWMPLAASRLSLDHMRSADAWLIVPGDSEGHAAGTPIEAFLLRDFT